jgi:hypothetical protein
MKSKRHDDSKKCKDKHRRCRHKHSLTQTKVTSLSPFPCPPTSNDPTGTGAVFPNTEAEPNIDVGVNPIGNDPMVVVCYQQDRFNHLGGCNADYMKISLDDGKSFGDPIALRNVQCFGGPYERASDPHVAITANGDILFAGIPLNVVANQASGLTISKYDVKQQKFLYTTDLDPQKGTLTGPNDTGSDYPTLIVDPQDCTGNTAYMGWTKYWALNPDQTFFQSNLAFSKTTDGINWSPLSIYAEVPSLDLALGYDPSVGLSDTTIGINQFTLLEQPDKPYSKIIAGFNDVPGYDYGAADQYNLMYSVYSEDQGATWSKPYLINITANGGSGQTPTQIVDPDDYTKQIRGGDGNPYMASDRKNNRVYAVANLDSLLNQPNPRPSGIYMFVSLDGAKSWRTVGKINRYPEIEAFNPSITVLENGLIVVSYYDFRNHKANPDITLPLETDRWMDIFEYDEDNNTVTLVNEIRLTPTSFNFRLAIPLIGGNQLPGGYFLGDYMGLTSYKHKIYNDYGIANVDRNNICDIYLSIKQ